MAHQLPYQDSSLSPEVRTEDLLARMTLEEKIGQMTQRSFIGTKEEFLSDVVNLHVGSFLDITDLSVVRELQEVALQSRLGIPILFELDSVHGNNYVEGATVFPSQMAMGSAWSPRLMEAMGDVVRKESIACGMKLSYSPTLCLAQDPRWGRFGECFSEDPYLTGELAASEIRGLQAGNRVNPQSVCANAKHYVGYGASIGGRDSYETGLSRRRLLDFYLPPFLRAVEAGVGSIMAAYHSNDGVPCSADRWLLTHVLRDAGGFDGVVITDWDNLGHMVRTQLVCQDLDAAITAGIAAGNDMMMSTSGFPEATAALVRSGRVDESLIDEGCRRVLRLKFRLGLFEDPCLPDERAMSVLVGREEHLAVCTELSDQGVILLKNDGVLPLPSERIVVGLIGPNADSITAQLGDWSFGNYWATHEETGLHADTVTVARALGEYAEETGRIELRSFPQTFTFQMAEQMTNDVLDGLASCDVVVAVVGDSMQHYGELCDRSSISLPGSQRQALERVHELGVPIIAVFVHAKPVGEAWIKQHAAAILDAWNPGCRGGSSIVRVLTGEVNPSGRLTVSIPYESSQAPVYYNQMPGWHCRRPKDSHMFGNYLDQPEDPLWPFGYGLSYTTFDYRDLAIDTVGLGPGSSVRCSVTVTNTGTRDGWETVQAYLEDLVSSHVREKRQLKAFNKVLIRAGESRTVELAIPFEHLALTTQDLRSVVERGSFAVWVGPNSVPGNCLRATFEVAETVVIRRFPS